MDRVVVEIRNGTVAAVHALKGMELDVVVVNHDLMDKSDLPAEDMAKVRNWPKTSDLVPISKIPPASPLAVSMEEKAGVMVFSSDWPPKESVRII